jgi:hypothetical protein
VPAADGAEIAEDEQQGHSAPEIAALGVRPFLRRTTDYQPCTKKLCHGPPTLRRR